MIYSVLLRKIRRASHFFGVGVASLAVRQTDGRTGVGCRILCYEEERRNESIQGGRRSEEGARIAHFIRTPQ